MSTRDNAPPPEGWACEPRCCPFAGCVYCTTPTEDLSYAPPVPAGAAPDCVVAGCRWGDYMSTHCECDGHLVRGDN